MSKPNKKSKSNNMDSANRKSPKNKNFTKNSRTSEVTDDVGREVVTNVTERAQNHPAWLAPTEQMALDAGRVQFSSPLGNMFSLDTPDGVNLGQTSIPGICSIKLHPGVGRASSHSDPINLAARQIYSYTRKANSGSKNYDYADEMIYIIAMSQVYSYWAWLRRLYGAVNMYTPYNKYYPRSLILAMGVDPDDIINNIANLRAYVNNFALKLNQFFVPASMPYFARAVWYFDSIFVDSPGIKAQTYLFNPTGFYKFALHPDNQSGMLKYVPMPTSADSNYVADLQALTRFGDELLDAVLLQQDMGIISGDIGKAYTGNTFVVPQTGDDHLALPVYDFDALMMIKNATVMGEARNTDVTQSLGIGEGYLICDPLFDQGELYADLDGTVLANKRLMSLDVDNPDPYMVLRSSYLMNMIDEVTSDQDGLKLRSSSLGTYWVESFQVISMEKDAEDSDKIKPVLTDIYSMSIDKRLSYDPLEGSVVWNDDNLVDVVGKLSRFKSHPCVYLFTDPAAKVGGFIFEVETYNVMQTEVLRRLHECIMLGEFRVPNT